VVAREEIHAVVGERLAELEQALGEDRRVGLVLPQMDGAQAPEDKRGGNRNEERDADPLASIPRDGNLRENAADDNTRILREAGPPRAID
jgi:hypothetical protein